MNLYQFIDSKAYSVGFFQNIRSAFAKSTAGPGKDMDELNIALQQIVFRAVASTEVVDSFAAAGLKNPEISILSDEFLTEVKGMERKNLAFEMLKKLLQDQIRSRSRKMSFRPRISLKCLKILFKGIRDG